MKVAVFTIAVLTGLLVLMPTHARAASVLYAAFHNDHTNDIDVHVHVGADEFGTTEAHGVAVFRTRRDTEVFAAESEGTTTSWADANGNGRVGFTGAQIAFRNVRSGERFFAIVLPDAGEIDEDGWHPVTARIGETSIPGRLRLTTATLFR